jgi:hypothetical protein
LEDKNWRGNISFKESHNLRMCEEEDEEEDEEEVRHEKSVLDKKYEKSLNKRRIKADKLLLRTNCGISEDDEEFEPRADLLKALTRSVHAQSRIELRDVEKERILGALNSPHLTRGFHCLSTIRTKQLTLKGEICIMEGSLLRLRYKDSGHETEVPQDGSLIDCFLFRPDRTLVEDSPPGTVFRVLIEFSKTRRVRTLVVEESNGVRMKLKFVVVSKKKILYGNPDNPNRIILVVDPSFTTIITVIRPAENREVCSVPVEWEDAIKLTSLTQTSPEQHIVYVPSPALPQLFPRKKHIEENTYTCIQIEDNVPTQGLSKISIVACPGSVSIDGNELAIALDEVKDISEFDHYERKLQRMF